MRSSCHRSLPRGVRSAAGAAGRRSLHSASRAAERRTRGPGCEGPAAALRARDPLAAAWDACAEPAGGAARTAPLAPFHPRAITERRRLRLLLLAVPGVRCPAPRDATPPQESDPAPGSQRGRTRSVAGRGPEPRGTPQPHLGVRLREAGLRRGRRRHGGDARTPAAPRPALRSPGVARGGSPERSGGGLGSAGPAEAAGGRRRAAALAVGGAAPSSRLRTLRPAAARLPPLTFIFARPFNPQ